jgi:hypothetical protein
VPPEGCVWQPTLTYGLGARGGQPGLAWLAPITVSPRFWVSGSGVSEAVTAPIGF